MNYKKDLRYRLSSKQKYVNYEHNSKWYETHKKQSGPSRSSSSNKSDLLVTANSVEEKQKHRDKTWNELKRKHRGPSVNQSKLINRTASQFRSYFMKQEFVERLI
jgi:hypothetical protein